MSYIAYGLADLKKRDDDTHVGLLDRALVTGQCSATGKVTGGFVSPRVGLPDRCS